MVQKMIGISILILVSVGGMAWFGNHRKFRSNEPMEHARNAKHKHAERHLTDKSQGNYPSFLASAVEADKHLFGKVASPPPEQIGEAMDDLLSLDASELSRIMARAKQLQDGPVMRRFLMAALLKLAQQDPNAALEWFQETFRRYPDLIDAYGKESLVFSVAGDNPELAFRMLEGNGFNDLHANPIQLIATAATTFDARTKTLSALRDHIATLPDEGSAREIANGVGIYHLVKSAVREGFEPATQWISESSFSLDELSFVTKGLAYAAKTNEIDRWIHWVMETVPGNDAAESTRIMFSRWCRLDDQAAADWLVNAAESHTKNAAIVGYIQTFAYLEPEIITQWAELLPIGRARASAMKRIYEEWPKEDPVARKSAEEFAKKQGFN